MLRLCSPFWLTVIVIIYIAAFGFSIWNIVLSVQTLGAWDAPLCAELLRTFLIGGVVASALVLLAYGAGVGTVFLLIWVLIGQMWYNDVREECADIPSRVIETVRTSLIILWFDLASFLAVTLMSCFSLCCSMAYS